MFRFSHLDASLPGRFVTWTAADAAHDLNLHDRNLNDVHDLNLNDRNLNARWWQSNHSRLPGANNFASHDTTAIVNRTIQSTRPRRRSRAHCWGRCFNGETREDHDMAVTSVTTKALNLSTSFAQAGFDNSANAGGLSTTVTQALSMAHSRHTGGGGGGSPTNGNTSGNHTVSSASPPTPPAPAAGGSPSDGGGTAPSRTGSGSGQRARGRAAAVRARVVVRRRRAATTASSLCGTTCSR
jgi:hypothetical protein